MVTGSHLDSVPDGGAYDGPLGVVSAFAAIDALRERGFGPAVPIGVVHFGDEEGARFGIACAGSRVITGALAADRARALTDADGISWAEAYARTGRDPQRIGPDPDTLSRVGAFVELHVEQGRGLVDCGAPVGVGTGIWPHGRWRLDFAGEANHAGTTALDDRQDAMLGFARTVLAARDAAERHGCLTTVGKAVVRPNGVNAIPSAVTGWLDARGADEERRACGRRGHRGRGRRRPDDRRVLDRRDAVRPALGRSDRRPARRRPAAGDRRRPRRRHPGRRRDPDRDAVRPQPDRRLALPRRVRRARPTAGPGSPR